MKLMKSLKYISLTVIAFSVTLFSFAGEKTYTVGGHAVSVNDHYLSGAMLVALHAPKIDNSWSAMAKLPYQGVTAMFSSMRSQYEGQIKQLANDIPYLTYVARRELDRNQVESTTDAINELIANILHDKRRAIGYEFKSMTPDYLQASIFKRNIKKYNDPYGPTISYLRAQGKNWNDIITSACKPNGGDLSWLNLGKWF